MEHFKNYDDKDDIQENADFIYFNAHAELKRHQDNRLSWVYEEIEIMFLENENEEYNTASNYLEFFKNSSTDDNPEIREFGRFGEKLLQLQFPELSER